MGMNNHGVMNPNKMGAMAAPKPKNVWGTIRRLLGYMKKSGFLIVLSVAVAIAGTVMQVINPKMLGNATTVIFEGIKQGTGIDFSALGTILLFVGLLYAGVFVTSFLQQRLMTVVSQKTTRVLRGELKAKMNRVPVAYFDKHQNGELMSVAANDVDNIVTNLQQSLTSLISNVAVSYTHLDVYKRQQKRLLKNKPEKTGFSRWEEDSLFWNKSR